MSLLRRATISPSDERKGAWAGGMQMRSLSQSSSRSMLSQEFDKEGLQAKVKPSTGKPNTTPQLNLAVPAWASTVSHFLSR